MDNFAILYGKESNRQLLTDAAVELSWSSARDEIARSSTVRLRNAADLKVAYADVLFTTIKRCGCASSQESVLPWSHHQV